MSQTPSFQLFRSLDNAETFPTGATIFNAGDAGDCMYAVQDGEVDLLIGSEVIETVGPGGIFGEMALIEGEPRSATAVAHTAARVVKINEARFNFLTQNTPLFALNVLRLISRRLREMDERAQTSQVF